MQTWHERGFFWGLVFMPASSSPTVVVACAPHVRLLCPVWLHFVHLRRLEGLEWRFLDSWLSSSSESRSHTALRGVARFNICGHCLRSCPAWLHRPQWRVRLLLLDDVNLPL